MRRFADTGASTARLAVHAGIALAVICAAAGQAIAQCKFNGVRGYTDEGRPSPEDSCQALYLFEGQSSADGRTITFESEGRQYKAELGGGEYYYIETEDVTPPTKSEFAAVFQINKEGMMTSGYCGDGFIVLALDTCE